MKRGAAARQHLAAGGAPPAPRRRARMLPRRKRICDSREPVRTRIGKVRGLISRKSGPAIALRHLVEGARLVGDDAGEDVEPTGRAFRVGARGDVRRAARGFRAAARCRRSPSPAPRRRRVGNSCSPSCRSFSATEKSGPGRKLARTRVAFGAEPEVEARRLHLVVGRRLGDADRAIGDQPPDRAVRQDALSLAVVVPPSADER